MAITKQSLKPNRVIVFQNGEYKDLSGLRRKYAFDVVISSINTKYFGRFAYCLSLDSEYFIVMDDDVIPGSKCFEVYINESKRLGAIVGGNGRIATTNTSSASLYQPPDCGLRSESVLVDFVGHLWVFRKAWLSDMFSVMPLTLDTGEDMHLCFAAKLKSGVSSYVAAQRSLDELSDTSNNRLAVDKYSSFKYTPSSDRVAVERYFSSLGVRFIQDN